MEYLTYLLMAFLIAFILTSPPTEISDRDRLKTISSKINYVTKNDLSYFRKIERTELMLLEFRELNAKIKIISEKLK